MAGARALAITVLLSGCAAVTSGPSRTSGAPASGTYPATTQSSLQTLADTPTMTAAITASPGHRCGDSRGTSPLPQYAFPRVSIPLGSDACQDIGPFTHPKFLDLTNDGSLVAFNAADYDHQGELWFGDLATGSVKIVYQANEPASTRVDVWWPQLAGGQLVWLEYVHEGADVYTPVKQWFVKDMDLATRQVRAVAQGFTPREGGQMLVKEIRYDGWQIGMTESLASGWQIQIIDLAGRVHATIPTASYTFDVALVGDGVLYSTGTEDTVDGTVGLMHLWHWTPADGATEIGKDVFQINADGNLAAWVTDPVASQHSMGNFQVARLYEAATPYTSSQPISPVDTETGSKGIDGMACGSGTVAWWERENYKGAWSDVLTLWQPGWSSPLQVDTEGNESYRVSDRGGWLVWTEEFGRDADPLLERVRGVPLAVLTAQRPS